MKRICLLILILVWVWSLMAMPSDSVGMKQVGSQSYIVYKLNGGETVYAVSRKYNVSFQSIKDSNPGVDMNAIQLGQEILIPRTTVIVNSKNSNGGSMHIVAKGETVYSISKQYGLEVSALQNENPEIRNNAIQTGQVLTIPTNNTASVKKDNKTVESNPQTTPVEVAENSNQETLTDINNTTPEISNTRTDKNKSFAQLYANYRFMDLVEISEKGVATWIDASSDMKVNNDRYYALHNTAPIGSVVKVRNLMNNREIYAKVIGTLSVTEVSDKTVIKLSAGAAGQLNVLDSRFVAEITHFEPKTEVSN